MVLQDNVGGEALDAALNASAAGARFAVGVAAFHPNNRLTL